MLRLKLKVEEKDDMSLQVNLHPQNKNIETHLFEICTNLLLFSSLGITLQDMSKQMQIPCKESILNKVLEKPTTFMKLVSECQCATETVEKYLSVYIEKNSIKQKKGKFRVLYSPELDEEIVEFYEILLNPTTKAILLVLLKSNLALSQIELVATIEKSNPSISRGLKLLLERKIITRNYHAPFSTYQISNKTKLFEMLEKTYPKIATNFEQFDLCYPKPKIFLDVYQ